jgi:hypothetical protein
MTILGFADRIVIAISTRPVSLGIMANPMIDLP